jgi:hypothetical protein
MHWKTHPSFFSWLKIGSSLHVCLIYRPIKHHSRCLHSKRILYREGSHVQKWINSSDGEIQVLGDSEWVYTQNATEKSDILGLVINWVSQVNIPKVTEVTLEWSHKVISIPPHHELMCVLFSKSNIAIFDFWFCNRKLIRFVPL